MNNHTDSVLDDNRLSLLHDESSLAHKHTVLEQLVFFTTRLLTPAAVRDEFSDISCLVKAVSDSGCGEVELTSKVKCVTMQLPRDQPMSHLLPGIIFGGYRSDGAECTRTGISKWRGTVLGGTGENCLLRGPDLDRSGVVGVQELAR